MLLETLKANETPVDLTSNLPTRSTTHLLRKRTTSFLMEQTDNKFFDGTNGQQVDAVLVKILQVQLAQFFLEN
jgi:hypothetical protein